MFSFFKKNKIVESSPLVCDVHSHLIPAIDDGVKTLEEALETLRLLMDFGYRKIITTPHIYSDMYRNDIRTISDGAKKLNAFLREKNFDFTIEYAAEYYFDHWFFNEVSSNNPLLTFGKKNVLFETNYLTEPYQLKTLIFNLVTAGYRPVLAHPERYHYMTLEKAEDLKTRGVLLQLNLLSLTGYYGKSVQGLAHQLIDRRLVDLVGSDCHNAIQAKKMSDLYYSKYFKKVIELPLLNFEL